MTKVILGLVLFFGVSSAWAQTCEENFTAAFSYYHTICVNEVVPPNSGCTFTPIYENYISSWGNPALMITCKRVCPGNDDFLYNGFGREFCDTKVSPVAIKRIIQNIKPVMNCGSIVQTENQVVGESVPIVGTSISMNYFSNWVQGRKADYNLVVPIAGDTPRDGISSFDVVLKRNGSTIQSTSFTNNQSNVDFEYLWDGNISSTSTLGSVKFDVSVTEHRTGLSIPLTSSIYLGSLKAKNLGLGGWLPSNYHFYDTASGNLYSGDGSIRPVKAAAWNTTGYMIPEENGSRVYYFDSTGRQVYTKTGLTGQTIETFNYDGSGRLTSISEPFSRTTTFHRNLGGYFSFITSPRNHGTSVTLDSNGYVASFTNPNSETYGITYDAGGLMQTFTKPGGQVSTFTYDSLGNLSRDAHSGGFFFDLVRNVTANNMDQSYITKMGKETKYQGWVTPNNISRTTTYPSGQQDTFNYSSAPYATTENSVANGYTSSVTYIDDARFGASGKFPTSSTIYYGPSYIYTSNTQNITLLDPTDPFSIDTYSVSSQKGNLNITTDYNPSTKKFNTYTALGKTSETIIDSYERVTSQKRGNLYPVEFIYTNENLTKIKQNARETTLTYDSKSILTSITNPLSQTTALTYDSAGRLASKIFPDLRTITYSYDANGNISGITPPGRTIHSFGLNASELPNSYAPPTLSGVSVVNTTYSYNNDKQLTEINKPNGDSIAYTYNSTTGVLETVTTPTNTYTYVMHTYNGLPYQITPTTGPITQIGYAGTIPTSYTNYGASYTDTLGYTALLSTDGTLGSDKVDTYYYVDQVYYTYDNDEYLTGAGDLTLSYSTPSALLTGTSLGTSPNIVTDEYTYNSFGEVTNYKAKYGTTVIYDLDLTRDGMGRINGKTQTMNSTTEDFDYTFDSAGRITQTDKNSTTVATYGYDSNSNRNSGSINGTSTSATYDAQDRMTAYNLLTFTYNANGDLTSKTNTLLSTTTNYTYDVFGNLTSVTLPNSDVITYEIDGLNRRIGKSLNGTLQARWVYMDQTRIAAEVDASGNITKRFVYGSKGNIPDYMIMGSDNYRIISDHLGSPRLVVKVSDGAIAARMNHDEFGRVTTNTNPNLLPFGFAGGLYDTDTQLVRFGARDYDSEAGRWTAKDPIRFDGGDTNFYGYVANDPVNWVDPSGLKIAYGNKQSRTLLQPLIEQLMQSPAGAALISQLESSSATYTLNAVSGGPSSPGNAFRPIVPGANGTVNVDVCPNVGINTNRGVQTATPLRILAHELGHLTGTRDNGPGRMNNVNGYENPIMTPIDGLIRTSY